MVMNRFSADELEQKYLIFEIKKQRLSQNRIESISVCCIGDSSVLEEFGFLSYNVRKKQIGHSAGS